MRSKTTKTLLRIGICIVAIGAAFMFFMPAIRKNLLMHRIKHEITNSPSSHMGMLANISAYGNPKDALQVLWELAIDSTSTANEKDQAGYAITMLATGYWELSTGSLATPSSPSSEVFSSFMENKLQSSSDQEKELASRVLDLLERRFQ